MSTRKPVQYSVNIWSYHAKKYHRNLSDKSRSTFKIAEVLLRTITEIQSALWFSSAIAVCKTWGNEMLLLSFYIYKWLDFFCLTGCEFKPLASQNSLCGTQKNHSKRTVVLDHPWQQALLFRRSLPSQLYHDNRRLFTTTTIERLVCENIL